MSWDPAIATTKPSHSIYYTTWSPCNRVIAISEMRKEEVHILDAVTLKQLKSLNSPEECSSLPIFSPDGCTLTAFGHESEIFTCWDLQTGVPICKITEQPAGYIRSTTYSGCGMMLGILFKGDEDLNKRFSIGTYSFHTSAPICHHPIEGLIVVDTIWACGECVQFATLDIQSITIWEVGFTSTHPPTRVRSLPTPDNFDPWGRFHFHPTPPKVAFNDQKSLLVWDVYHSKILLDYADFESGTKAFSPDGHFFACVPKAKVGEIYLWEESPTGYILHRRLQFNQDTVTKLFLSPNGQSVVVSDHSTIQLLHTKDSTTSTPSVLTQPIDYTRHPILVFSQDRSLAVTTLRRSNTVTVVDLRSGIPWLHINTGMPVYGAGITRSTVAVVCDRKVITWNIPLGDCVHNTKVDINDSVQTISFHYSSNDELSSALISPDSSYLVIVASGIRLYDMSTGRLLAGTFSGYPSCFTSDGHEIWSDAIPFMGKDGWAIVQDSGSNATGLKCLHPSRVYSRVFPWHSPHGCKVMNDGWILNSSGKRLLWLPHHWRLDEEDQVWGGQFLAMLDKKLPEVVILELLEV